jgi:CHAD domain-containing protein
LRDGSEIELAIDLGSIHAEGRELAVAEAELELKSGRPDGLYSVAMTLAETLPLQIEAETKSDRGYRLYAGEGLLPSRAPHVALSPDSSIEEAWCRVLEAGLGHLARNAKVFLQHRPIESVHQMRVAIRRLRAAFSAFRPIVESPESESLRESLRETAKVLGRARDLDVFAAEALNPLMKALGPDPRLDKLARAIARARAKAYDDARRVLIAPDYARLVLDLRRFIDGRIWRRTAGISLPKLEAPALDFAKSILERRYKKALRIGRHLDALQGDERHQMRIELKKLRYAGDFFESLFSRKRVKAYLGHMAELQDRLGYLNDTEVAEGLVQELIADAPIRQRTELAFAGGLVIGWKSERAQKEWNKLIKLWPEFVERPVFWK